MYCTWQVPNDYDMKMRGGMETKLHAFLTSHYMGYLMGVASLGTHSLPTRSIQGRSPSQARDISARCGPSLTAVKVVPPCRAASAHRGKSCAAVPHSVCTPQGQDACSLATFAFKRSVGRGVRPHGRGLFTCLRSD
jgi:hypothetical protein